MSRFGGAIVFMPVVNIHSKVAVFFCSYMKRFRSERHYDSTKRKGR
jgi:hypothetical protein